MDPLTFADLLEQEWPFRSLGHILTLPKPFRGGLVLDRCPAAEPSGASA